jgi:curved DNA-binding protein CbpA
MTGLDTGREYHRLLGVPRNASTPEIRRAYRRLARQNHPDRNPHPDSAERFGVVADAYAALNDPARRVRHDHRIPAPRAPQAPGRPPSVPSSRSRRERGTLELSTREAQLAAARPLKLAAPHGTVIVVPAGIHDGDHIIIRAADNTIVLSVRVNQNT